MPVKKRCCYSGGSVQRYSNGFNTMRQSSSFSLPSHANALSSPYDPAGLHPRPIGPVTCGQVGDLWGHAASPMGGGLLDMQRSLSCSHEQFSFAEYCPPSASSTPASTPEPARRSGGLARSRSQPCVLNDKKVGIKRRRPEEAQEQRPSLDLAKMAQVRAPSLPRPEEALQKPAGVSLSLPGSRSSLGKGRVPTSKRPGKLVRSLVLKI